MAAFERAVGLDPNNAEAWSQLGDAARNMEDDSTAVVAYRRALTLDPTRPITLFGYAGTVPPAEAESLLDSALAVDPGFLLARRARAGFQLGRGDTSGARRDFEVAGCEACPADMLPSMMAAHATVLHLLGDTAAARAEAEGVIARLRPSGGLASHVVGRLASYFLELGDTDKALDLLERIEPRGVRLWTSLRSDPVYYSLARNPRFRRLLADDAALGTARARDPRPPHPDGDTGEMGGNVHGPSRGASSVVARRQPVSRGRARGAGSATLPGRRYAGRVVGPRDTHRDRDP